MVSLEYRQQLVDVAVSELQRQLGEEGVDQSGTRLQIEGSFKMARVLEAVVRVAFHHNMGLQDAIGRDITRILGESGVTIDPSMVALHAIDVLNTIEGWMLAELDPLP